ncbi:MAG: hypothetical protein K2Y37_27140 [Pirellulales bacterium]|nr:hypothetical protein [Pirellulales bacterium]
MKSAEKDGFVQTRRTHFDFDSYSRGRKYGHMLGADGREAPVARGID